jgi:hypothetical protein
MVCLCECHRSSNPTCKHRDPDGSWSTWVFDECPRCALDRLTAERDRLKQRLESWYRMEAKIRSALRGFVGDDVYLKALETIVPRDHDHNPLLTAHSGNEPSELKP